MSVNIIFRIAAVGILVTILVQVLKHSGRDEQAFLITLAGLILVLGWVIPYIYDLFESVQTLFTISYRCKSDRHEDQNDPSRNRSRDRSDLKHSSGNVWTKTNGGNTNRV